MVPLNFNNQKHLQLIDFIKKKFLNYTKNIYIYIIFFRNNAY